MATVLNINFLFMVSLLVFLLLNLGKYIYQEIVNAQPWGSKYLMQAHLNLLSVQIKEDIFVKNPMITER